MISKQRRVFIDRGIVKADLVVPVGRHRRAAYAGTVTVRPYGKNPRFFHLKSRRALDQIIHLITEDWLKKS